jgi:hypothetical protein
MSSRQGPTRPPAKLADLELIVKPAGRPDAVRAFTGDERDEAERYAAEAGAEVEPLG